MNHMDNNLFTDICKTLNNRIRDWGEAYRILEGQNNGKPNKCFIVEVNGQNYLQVDSAQFISFHELFPRTKYQKPIYLCLPNKDGLYSLLKHGEVVLKEKECTVEAIIDEVFGDIENKLQKKKDVAQLLGKMMGFYILPDEIEYDIKDKTYHFRDWSKPAGREYLWFCNYFRNMKESIQMTNLLDDWYVAKYTSLDTALKILNSGKMRMMSVTAMNDKLEIGHLYGKLQNEDSAYIEDKTKVHSARHRYITSFTNRIDDLTMWRLYGDNAQGVCLVFSEPYECNYCFPVDYSGRDSELHIRTKRICDELDKHGIKFTFKSLETTWQYFLKPKGFSDEQELRYLKIDNSKPDGYTLASNGVISTYKDYSLIMDNEHPENSFPASLQGVILGPNMENAEINKFQLEALAEEKGLFLFKGVQNSSINYYL